MMDTQPLHPVDYGSFGPSEYGPSYAVRDCRPNLYDLLCEAEHLQEDGRHFRLSSLRDRAASRLAGSRFNPGRVVKAFCLAVAVFNVVFWGGQLLRVFL